METLIQCIQCGSTNSNKFYHQNNIYFCQDCNKCVKCLINDSLKHDPFMVIFDDETNNDISYKFCQECLETFIKCNKCNKVSDEPWYKYKFNLITNSCICESCIS